MTYSQKIARFLEIVSYFMLIPAAFGVFAGAIAIFFAPWFTLIIWVIAGLGISLLVGYFKHSRDRLPVEKINRMWYGTIVYNLIPLLFSFYYFYQKSIPETHPYNYERDDNGFIFMVLLAFWWTIAVFASASALYKNYRDDEKYL
jgi:hypothetical protein